jgi:multidrug efflux pump subunit AcrB
MPFGIIMTGVGVISLAGVVVNNAIVLLDYAEQLRARGYGRREAVIETGVRRLRPVLLTAITTILGLVPLTTGLDFDFRTLTFSTNSESSQYWRSMGVAVIFGLAFATFLTLVLVPVLYDLLLAWRERRGSKPAGSEPPGIVGRGAVDRWHRDVEQTEIDRELAAVMDQVADHKPA